MSRILGRGRYIWGTYPGTGSAAGAGGASVPLSRQRFIDGDTTQSGLNGAIDGPFKTIAQFMASRPNTSVADATANYVGWVTPAILGYGADVAFPPYASTELRADSLTLLLGGTTIVGNVTWANIAGANAASLAVAAMHNITVGGDITVTDDVGAPNSTFVFGGDEIGQQSVLLSGSFDSTSATKLSEVIFQNAGITGTVNCGNTSDSAGVSLLNSICGGGIAANSLNSFNSSIDAAAITIDPGDAAFRDTQFALGSNPVLDCPAQVIFDGPSWRSFLEAGGARVPTATGTTLIIGGYSGGGVEGAALAAASTSVSLNGTGASVGFTGSNSGNHYSTASITPTSVTLLTGGGELPGDTLLITRTASVASNLAVVNGGPGAGTIGTVPSGSRGFVLARFDGTNWVFEEGGALAA